MYELSSVQQQMPIPVARGTQKLCSRAGCHALLHPNWKRKLCPDCQQLSKDRHELLIERTTVIRRGICVSCSCTVNLTSKVSQPGELVLCATCYPKFHVEPSPKRRTSTARAPTVEQMRPVRDRPPRFQSTQPVPMQSATQEPQPHIQRKQRRPVVEQVSVAHPIPLITSGAQLAAMIAEAAIPFVHPAHQDVIMRSDPSTASSLHDKGQARVIRPLFESLPKLAYPTPGPPHYNERGELLPPISMHLTRSVPLESNSNQSGPSLTPLTRSLTRQPMFADPRPAVRSTKPATQSPLIETPASTATSAPTPPIALPNFNAYQPESGSSSTPDLTQRHIRVCRMYGCSTILSPNHLWTVCKKCLSSTPTKSSEVTADSQSQRTKRTRLSLGDESIMRDPVNGQAQISPASLKSAATGRGEDQVRSDENATLSQHYKRLQMPLNTSSAEIIADCPSPPELPLIVHSLEHSDANSSSTSMNSSVRSHVTQRPGLAQIRELNRTGSDSPVSSDAYARSRSFIGTETHSGPSQQNKCSSVAETPHSVADAKGTVESPATLQSAQTSSEGQTSEKELTTNGMALLNREIPGSQTVVANVPPPALKCDAAGLLNEADGSLVPNSSDVDGDDSQDDDADMQSSTKSSLQRSPCIELSPIPSPTSRSPIGPSREVNLKSNTASDVALSDLTPLEASEGESEVDSSESESESDDEPLATKLRRNALSNNTRPTHSRKRSTATGRTFTVCSMRRCSNLMLPDSRWKLCEPCRGYFRRYQNKRRGKIDAKQHTADGKEVPDLSAYPPGSRICRSRWCSNVLPLLYRRDMCEACCSHLIRDHPSNVAPRTSDPLPTALYAGLRKLSLPQKRRLEESHDDVIHDDPVTKPEPLTYVDTTPTAYQYIRPLLISMQQRFLGFLNAQAHYLRYKYDQGAVVDAAKPTLFTFGGEYSVVADPTGGVVDTMAKDIAAHVQSVLGVKFKTLGVSMGQDQSVINNFQCMYEVFVPVPPSNLLPVELRRSGGGMVKQMVGDLGVSIAWDRRHRYFAGQRVEIRFKLFG